MHTNFDEWIDTQMHDTKSLYQKINVGFTFNVHGCQKFFIFVTYEENMTEIKKADNCNEND